ncbi:MAG: enoyl-CoA hydratase/isomerase family protein [Candidatus Nanopelagicales bacterium]
MTESPAPVVLSERSGAVRTITLNRPERLNAITPQLVDALVAALTEADGDPETRAVVLTGAGRAFCAGDDLKDLDAQVGDEEQVRAYVETIQDVTRALLGSRLVVVAAVRGWAVGGGLEWVLNCDLVVWGDRARGFFPELGLGLFPTGAATLLLPRLVGLPRAARLLLLGERIDAERAERWGLASEVVPEDEVPARAARIAEAVAGLPPGRVADLKHALVRAPYADPAAAMAWETEATVRGFLDPDTPGRAAR